MPIGNAGGTAVRRNYGTTQPTIVALRAVTLAERFNNQLVFVADVDSTFEFEPASVAVDDGVLILEPDDSPATGRWEKRGAGIVAPAGHAASHVDGSDDIQSATAAQKGIATAAQITKLDGIEALADVTSANAPQTHAAGHVDGSDDIQSATAAQKGVATAAQITKLDGIATGADVTAANAPQAHAASHVDGTDDIRDATAALKGIATAAQITKLDGIESGAVAAGTVGDAHAPLTTNPHAVTAAQAGAADAAHVGAGGAAHADVVAAGADGFMIGADKTKLNGIATGADVTGANAPQAHAASHTDGSDDIQSATAAQKGVATAAQITKLDGLNSQEINTVSTTDATVTTIATIPITDDSVNDIEARCLARRTDVDQAADYKRKATVFRRAAGVATLLGSQDPTYARQDDNQWDFDIVVSGNNVLLQVTGRAARSIDWKSFHELRSIT